ncbi:MAG: peptidase MA family metallohydrolase [Ignavibacterium sp.]|uniref:peptidase MA family metallohydrolase n=1 Tax=Ignavibacterium sp. TaxID=2651167 RepID=UPI00404A16A8
MKILFRFCFVFLLFTVAELQAQYFFFGRNKVQYEDFDWKVLRTEHFNVYYYGETETIAEIGAAYAEEIYSELAEKLNHVVTRKIPLIFYNTSNHFQQTNVTPGFIPEAVGGFFEFIKGRVVIPSTGSLSDFRHVIRHELVHVFMTNKVFRVLRDHRQPTDILPPLWFVEGLAEYLSTEVDAQAEMVMRDAVINNYFVGLKDIFKIYGSFLMYKEGQSFLEFIEEKYGAEKIPLMLENFWLYKNFDDILEHTLGKSIEEIDNEWSFHLKRKYFPLLTDKVPQEIGAKKLTDWGFNFSPVYYQTKDSCFIFFSANRDGYSSLYKLVLDKNYNPVDEPELILRGEKSDEFESFHLFQSAIDVSKSGLLCFVTKSGATDVIHFMNVSDNQIIKTFQRDFLISISSPKFSDAADKIVFQAVDQKGFSDIYYYDIANDSLIRLTNDYYDDRDPCFGINNKIIFSSDRTAGEFEGKYNLFTIEIRSKEIKYVTYSNANFYNPIISPDKKYLLFTSDLDTVRNIWIQKISDGKFDNKVTKVSNFFTSAFDPRFINDTTIVFSGFQNFSFHIYRKTIKTSYLDSSQTIVFKNRTVKGKWLADALQSESEFQKLNYEKEYSLDYAQSVVATDPVFGTRGGAILTLSDLLGDDQYYILLYNTAEVQSDFLRSFNLSITRLNLSRRVNFGYGIFNFNGRRYDIRESDEYFYEKSYGGVFLLSYPLTKFERIEASTTLADTEREIVPGISERKAFLLSNSISMVHDNSLWSTSGPVDGSRWLVLLGYTTDIKFSNVNYFSVIADYRYYLRLGLRTALATRIGFFYNEGKDARRYFMGGSWDLRGWPRWSIRGEKMWLTSLEFRFPLIDQINIRFPFLDLGFWGFRAATFFDVGSAWDKEYKTTYGSVGFGFRFNIFGVLVLRYDIGKKIEKDFTQFQPGLFYQFFFGWDF